MKDIQMSTEGNQVCIHKKKGLIYMNMKRWIVTVHDEKTGEITYMKDHDDRVLAIVDFNKQTKMTNIGFTAEIKGYK